jgi:asparagine synthase (glutamine-hydrolysing)
MPFLEVVDGTFTTVIYDQPRQKIVVACDRYGLQHIHWTQSRNYFAWATEYKSLTVLSDFAADIDTNALNDFIKYGYLTEDRTWFKSVNLLNGATVLSFDVNTHERITRRYWSWEKIKILDNLVDERECTEEWGRRFKEAVNRRMFPHRRIGVTLSGGLDSRAILAAMPVPEDNIHTFTFGVQDCDDIRIASQVASLKGTIHQNCYLDKAAWLDKNVAAVWATDGEIALLDTNGNEFLSFIEGYIDICMNGFGGDALHGGSFLGMKNQHVTTTDDPYGFRGRRYIRQGFRFDQSFYIVRFPFYDNKLIEFQLSIPEKLRKKSYIYNKSLLNNFPAFFKHIPWQKSGIPISYPTSIGKIISNGKKASSHILRVAQRCGLPVKDTRNYVNHLHRTLDEPGRSFFNELFYDRNAHYGNYIKREKIITLWENHLGGKHATTLVNRYATFELWLQQIFEQKYRCFEN